MMRFHSSLQVSLQTLLATSSLLGHELEDRSPICDAQDLGLFEELTAETACTLRGDSQRELFCVSPLDILVSDHAGRKRFHLLELNGTGIGGLTNMPQPAVCSTLNSLSDWTAGQPQPDGVVLLAVSGKESVESPRLNRLMHEKLLFVDAMRRGLETRFGDCRVRTLSQLRTSAPSRSHSTPTVVVGYIKELLFALQCDSSGRLWLDGHRVRGAVNDRFCRNVLRRFDERVDLAELRTLNRCFVPGSDKGVAYELMNSFVRQHPHRTLPDEVLYAHAEDRAMLFEVVLEWLRLGRQVVIKPHGTGLGHGIEFFLDPDEPRSSVAARIDGSLRQTEEYYGIAGGALPYTVCEYVDACRVADAGHRLEGHKFELRVVVYRDGRLLRAVPSIAKVARERADSCQFERRALINNITACGDTAKVRGTDFMLPLCNRDTLHTLGLTERDLRELCEFATGFVRHTLDAIEDFPQRFGLPAACAPVAIPVLQAA